MHSPVSENLSTRGPAVLNQRLLSISLGIAILLIALSWAMSGRLGFSLMPRVESDQVQATVTLPIGSNISVSRELSQQLLDAADVLSELMTKGPMQMGTPGAGSVR